MNNVIVNNQNPINPQTPAAAVSQANLTVDKQAAPPVNPPVNNPMNSASPNIGVLNPPNPADMISKDSFGPNEKTANKEKPLKTKSNKNITLAKVVFAMQAAVAAIGIGFLGKAIFKLFKK